MREAILLELNASISSVCLPKVRFSPSSAKRLRAMFLVSSLIIASERDGLITRIVSPAFSFLGKITFIPSVYQNKKLPKESLVLLMVGGRWLWMYGAILKIIRLAGV
jgi:hypothetical protein